MGRFPELFNETHQDCWTLCEHVTGAKRLHIKVHQVGIVLQFPPRPSDSSHILAALLYSPWRPLQWLCFILVLVQFKKTRCTQRRLRVGCLHVVCSRVRCNIYMKRSRLGGAGWMFSSWSDKKRPRRLIVLLQSRGCCRLLRVRE